MPKTKYSQDDIAKQFAKHMADQYKFTDFSLSFNDWCANHWDCSASRISNIISGREAPNEFMLKDMGFIKVKKTWFERVK